MSNISWEPPALITREAIVAASDDVLGRADKDACETSHVFTLQELGLEWDIGYTVYQPVEALAVPRDPLGRSVGFFLLHGG